MPEVVLTNAGIVLGGYNLAGYTNSLALKLKRRSLDNTRYGPSGWMQFARSLPVADASCAGYIDVEAAALAPDSKLFSQLDIEGESLTLGATGHAAEDVAYSLIFSQGSYSPGGQVGELLRFNVSGRSNGAFFRGLVLANTTLSDDGQTAWVSLGQVPEGYTIHAVIHVLAIDGTADFVLQSDAAVPDGATDRITFDQFAAIGDQKKKLSGPLAPNPGDSNWRLSVDLSVEGSVTFLAVAGIRQGG